LLESPGKQAELEKLLLAKNGSESIKMAVVSGGKNNKLYIEYLTLVDRYKDKNRHQKDSLQQVAVRYSDHRFLQEEGRIQKLLSKDWLVDVKNELLTEEIDFMKENIDNEVIHRIYQIQLNNKEDVERYREIYNLFPFNVRQNLANNN
jgi:prophage DNA circulation protein